MENGQHADGAAKPACITAEIDDRLGRGVHQRAIAQTLPSSYDGVEFLGQGDGDMEIRNRQHLGLTFVEPGLGLIAMAGRAAAVATAMVDMDLVAAAVALPDLPSESRGSTGENVGDGAPMRGRHRRTMGGQIELGEPIEDRLKIDQPTGSEAGHDLVQ